jgi:hypothetical protein
MEGSRAEHLDRAGPPRHPHSPGLTPRRRSLPFGVCVLVAGCSYNGDDPRTPAPYRLLRSSPAPGALGVARNAPLDLFFEGAPAAETVTSLDVRLFSGLIETIGKVRVDLLARRVRFTPLQPLRPSLRHELYVSAAIRSLGGASTGESQYFDFTTGPDANAPPEPPRPEVRAAALQALWASRCTSCHSGTEPQAGLELSTPDGVVRSLRGAASREWGLQLVLPFDHSRSYLMRKLLGEGGIFGFDMPPTGARLTAAELRNVADWIDGGAQW